MKTKKNNKVKIFLAVASLILTAAIIYQWMPTAGNTYFVSQEGTDQAEGTEAKPFKSISRGIKELKPGDTLYIREGVYDSAIKLNDETKGRSNAYITIRNMPGEKVILSGKGKQRVLMDIEGSSYVKIRGIEFTDANGQESSGINIHPGTNNIIISDNEFHNIRVPSPETEDNTANCILILGDSAEESIDNVIIRGNNFYDCQTGWSECISVTGNATNITVENNNVRNTGNIGIDLSGNYGYCPDPALDFPRNCRIIGNVVRDCVSSYATSYGIYVDGGQNIQISDNEVTGSSGGIEIGAEKKPKDIKYSTKDIRVNGNKIMGNFENGITIGGYEKDLGWVKDIKINKNTCIDNGTSEDDAIITLSKCDGVDITDNVMYNNKIKCNVIYYSLGEKYARNIKMEGNQLSKSE